MYRIWITECIDVTEVQCVLYSYVVVVGRSRRHSRRVDPAKVFFVQRNPCSRKVGGLSSGLSIVSDYGRSSSSSVFRLPSSSSSSSSSSVTNFK